MKNLVREPLLHFLVLAAILFAFDLFWSATMKDRIFVDVREYLEGDWRMLRSRQAIEREIEQLGDDYEIVNENYGGQAQ